MKAKLLITLFWLIFSVLAINNCYSQGIIGKSASEVEFIVKNGRLQYHVERYDGKIQYVGVYYPNQLLPGVAGTNIYRYYMMKNGICDYILAAYDKVSLEQLKKYYDTNFLKEGKYYRSRDPYLEDERYEIILFDGKATVKLTLQKNSKNKNLSNLKNESVQQNVIKSSSDSIYSGGLAAERYKQILHLLETTNSGYVFNVSQDDLSHFIIIDCGSEFKNDGCIKYEYTCDYGDTEPNIQTAMMKITCNINVINEVKSINEKYKNSPTYQMNEKIYEH